MNKSAGSQPVNVAPELSKVSIVILTYERQSYIRRQIAYFWRFPVNLVIADGSEISMDLPSLDGAECSIHYIHFPGANTLNARFKLATQEVATEFAMMADDADLYFLTGIENAISELREEPDLLMSAGRVGLLQEANSADFVWTGWDHWGTPLELNENPEEKLLRLIGEKRTANLYYTLMRRETFVQVFGKIAELNFSMGAATEIFVAGSLVVRSDFHLGSYPFWIRGDAPSIAPAVNDAKSVPRWHEERGYEWESFVAALAKDLETYSEMRYQAATRIVEEYLKLHYAQAIAKPPLRGRRLLKTLMGYLPFGRIFFRKIMQVKGHFNKRPGGIHSRLRWNNAVEWGTSAGAKLSGAQELDLRRYQQLVSAFPRGIKSNDQLLSYVTGFE